MLLKEKSMLLKLPAIGMAAMALFNESSFIRLLFPPANIIPIAFIVNHLPL